MTPDLGGREFERKVGVEITLKNISKYKNKAKRRRVSEPNVTLCILQLKNSKINSQTSKRSSDRRYMTRWDKKRKQEVTLFPF